MLYFNLQKSLTKCSNSRTSCAGQFVSRGFVVLLRKSNPQNRDLQTAVEHGVRRAKMPQPLSRVNPNASIIIGNAGDRPLLRHPELAALAAEAIASWANVESFMLKLFVEMFGGNEALATNVFLSLSNQSAKNDAIRAAADSFFENGSDELAVFRALLAISKTNEKDRNKLAHWTWGDSQPFVPNVVKDMQKALYFALTMAPHSFYDLKTNENWLSSAEAGNYNYGYLGAAIGLEKETLIQMSGLVQLAFDKINQG